MIKLEAAITIPVTNAAKQQYSKTSLTTWAMTASELQIHLAETVTATASEAAQSSVLSDPPPCREMKENAGP
jgi:hypothetical protein